MTGLLLGLALSIANAATAAPAWDWSESVAYQENHDPGMVWLTDGRKLHVDYTQISWKEVRSWAKGRPLLIGYRPDVGVVLYDPSSNKQVPVLSGLKEHPIDLLTDKCLDANQTTMGMAGCYDAGTRRWEKELDRAASALLASLDAKRRPAVEESQKAWAEFRKRQTKTILAVHDRPGTINHVESARQTMSLVGDQAKRLDSLLE